jgi:NAD-dependent SIR2 family protein deacetylase
MSIQLSPKQQQQLEQYLSLADGLLICAGAGMGVDSGLPDFRGNQGFWQAYPALGAQRLDFTSIANPQAFRRELRLAWGFYGHRLALYRKTIPHQGFHDLKRLGEALPQQSFVFTSNVDGQFQQAGFADDRIVECHGSIHWLQCHQPCHPEIWSAKDFAPQIDPIACQLLNDAPTCPQCGGYARPNILMFGDWDWLEKRTVWQEHRLHEWLGQCRNPLVIELGAGTAVPSVRIRSEETQGLFIRVNPREYELPYSGGIALACGAKQGIDLIMKAAKNIGLIQ